MSKTALITGAASGIGKAIALQLASRGYNLCLIDRDEEALDVLGTTATTDGIQVSTLSFDLGDSALIDLHVREMLSRLSIDVLVNNAGTAVAADITMTDRRDWHRIFDVNVHAIYEMSRLIVPHMAAHGGGAIVNIASVAGIVGLQSRAAYCASKGAVVALTRAMAVDHAADNIRVNAVCPGTIQTGWIEEILSGNPDPEVALKNMKDRQILGRLGDPNEVASAVIFLIDNEFTTGSALVIDGGMTAR